MQQSDPPHSFRGPIEGQSPQFPSNHQLPSPQFYPATYQFPGNNHGQAWQPPITSAPGSACMPPPSVVPGVNARGYWNPSQQQRELQTQAVYAGQIQQQPGKLQMADLRVQQANQLSNSVTPPHPTPPHTTGSPSQILPQPLSSQLEPSPVTTAISTPNRTSPPTNSPLPTPTAPPNLEGERFTALLDLNCALLKGVMALQSAGKISMPPGPNSDLTSDQIPAAAKAAVQKQFVEYMRRVQSNLGYLGSHADKARRPDKEVPACPAMMDAPPQIAGAEDLDGREELVTMYEKVRELFPEYKDTKAVT